MAKARRTRSRCAISGRYFAFVLGVLCASSANGAASPAPGDRLAPFTLTQRDGRPVSWKPGRTTVLSFCAYWCDTWKTQVPRLLAAQHALGGMPVDFLTVSVDGRWVDKAIGPLLLDPGGAWSSDLGIDHVPYTLVVDAGGTIRWSRFGIVRTEDLLREAQSALSAPTAGAVYLTFDDFPSGPMDQDLLDVLRAADVKATFFVIGSKVRQNLDVVRRAVREGHRLEIHCWRHDSADAEIDRCRRELHELLGTDPSLVRPPGKEKTATLDGAVLGNPVADPYDYTRPGATEIVRRVMNLVKPDSILQLHVGVRDTLEALPELIRRLTDRGYRIDLLKRPE